ncbi:MAG: tRNA lysidine(34) synthetase TilS [Sphingomonas sp.]|nr:tRNA lysidine(34) synthetase TilS [Sphingomonas sp.]
MRALNPASVARLRDDLAALVGPLGGRRLAVAVSGGADSMALLALAVAAFPGQVIAATVDHGLRAESAEEAALVARWCAGAGVPHAVLTIADAPARGDNLHDWARARRYRLLATWALDAGASLLATAHHADDQAETFLMRAARGSGVAGLAGARAVQEMTWGGDLADGAVAASPQRKLGPLGGEALPWPEAPACAGATASGDAEIDAARALLLVRPLLGWRRAELRALAEAAGLPFVDDPSNADPRYDRARFRALLGATPLLDPARLAQAAAHVAEAEATLRAVELWLWRARATLDPGDSNGITLDMTELPRELRRRLARAAIAAVRAAGGITRPGFTPATNIEPLLDALAAGKAATQAGVLVRPQGARWRFAGAPPRRSR